MKNGECAAFACVDSEKQYLQKGLTKREYFAVLAMQGMLANPETYGDRKIMMYEAVRNADALLDELNYYEQE